ncbi:MAG: hypothetical protein WDO69_02090 [Pseudomonadota bacterium]
MKRPLALTLIALACLTSSCREERSHRVSASYSSVSKPTYLPAPKRAPAKAVLGIAGIPTEEDYEERAEASITEANLASKLKELEKEMAF